MKATTTAKIATAAASCATGLFLAVLAASPAGADPVDPAPPPPAPLTVLPAPGPPPGPDAIVQAAAPADAAVVPGAPILAPDAAPLPATPPNGVPHLASPDALPVPKLALRMLYGEAADMLLFGQRVVPKAAQDAGFEFRHPDLPGALAAALGP
jgi:hypothetical protein